MVEHHWVVDTEDPNLRQDERQVVDPTLVARVLLPRGLPEFVEVDTPELHSPKASLVVDMHPISVLVGMRLLDFLRQYTY